jgi:hypothetical protein
MRKKTTPNESKQLIPHEKTASDFKEKAVPPCEWRKKK